MITQKTLRGNRTPKSYILSGVRSSDGKRLDQDLNRNLGAEIAKLSREKSELQQGLGGGNTMATYKLKKIFSSTSLALPSSKPSIISKEYILKRFSNSSFSSNILKSYKLKRKNFGTIDGTVGHVTDFAGKTLNTTVGTVENVAGGALSGVGKGMNSFVGKGAGIVGGSLAGLALAPKIGALIGGVPGAIGGALLAPAVSAIGGIAGHAAMKGGGTLLKDVGDSFKTDAAARTA